MSVVVPPKIIRALTRTPIQLQIPSATDLACWNWALAGESPVAPPIGAVYDYVNGYGAAPSVATHPLVTPGALLALAAVRLLFAGHAADAYNAAKKLLLTQCSTAMLPALCQTYGLPVSAAQTDIEVGLKFEPDLPAPGQMFTGTVLGVKQYRPETAMEFLERKGNLHVGYEHMWIRLKKKTTIETWVNLPILFVHHAEQPPDAHKVVTRAYVTQLQPAHVAKLTALIQTRKGAAPFVHPAARQPWILDATVNNCRWCNVAFGFATRKHHCRACGRIFCSDCAFRTEMVATPLYLPGPGVVAPAGAVSRVCDTCYTGNL